MGAAIDHLAVHSNGCGWTEPLLVAGTRPSTVLNFCRRLFRTPLLQRVVLLGTLMSCWEAYARYTDNPLLLPRLSDTLVALWSAAWDGALLPRIGYSIEVLAIGYATGLGVASLLVMLAVPVGWGRGMVTSLAAMLNPLPAIALLPMALLWFGLGQASLIFVISHSVVWPVTLNAISGFAAVGETLRMSGRNYGLRGLRYVCHILVPAALPAILTGLKMAWAFGWRTLIAAEMVFGATSRSGGLGWFIYQSRSELDTPSVFAGLLVIVAIGLLAENAIFLSIEARTVRRWGMQR